MAIVTTSETHLKLETTYACTIDVKFLDFTVIQIHDLELDEGCFWGHDRYGPLHISIARRNSRPLSEPFPTLDDVPDS
jgi:hypothetical protein